MAKISANGAKEIARWIKPGGETYVLTRDRQGRTKLLRKWTTGAGYTVATIIVGRKTNGAPDFSERPTLEQASAWMKEWGYEQKETR